MINLIPLYFTKEFSSEYEPFQLLLGDSIGIIAIVNLIKKKLTEEIKNESFEKIIKN